MSDASKPAPGPYTTVEIGTAKGCGFHSYVQDANGRKIAAVWGPAEEKVHTAALFAAAHDLLRFLQSVLIYTVEGDETTVYVRSGDAILTLPCTSAAAGAILQIEAQRQAIVARATGAA